MDRHRAGPKQRGKIMHTATDQNTYAHAQWVADLMAEDGIKPEQVTPEIALAYLDVVGRKIVQIQSKYLTLVGAKTAMQQVVVELCKEKAGGSRLMQV
jgi:hypothetical protein